MKVLNYTQRRETGMRTNIEIDDTLMRKAMRASGERTKRATVEAALRTLIRLHDQRRLLDSFGKIPLDESAVRAAEVGHQRW